MNLTPTELRELLVGSGVLTAEQFAAAEQDASAKETSVAAQLVDTGLVSDENLGRLVADRLRIPFVALARESIPEDILRAIPQIVAKAQNLIAFRKDERGLHLAMASPEDIRMRDFVEKKIGLPVVVHYATERDIGNALVLYRGNMAAAFEDLVAEHVEKARGAAEVEPPIIKLVNTIITYAYENKSSDIHIEPLKEHVLVRFRIDGILHDIVKLPLDLLPRIVTRVKVLSKLRTDEHQAAQDGKIVFPVGEEDLDLRVSVVPTVTGENVVMRLLSERARQFALSDLGMGTTDLEKVRRAYAKPYGMLLATGPTGCGKTTTMYAILKLLKRPEVHIATIEDPVEYDIEGVTQIQVNPRVELTFAKGLRSIVRQDPNIILVGEIRDEETAGIAVNSAMTGHLVLSTLHTNDAATAIPRLIDMEVEPFLIASSVNVIIAQRLVRQICARCRASATVTKEELWQFFGKELVRRHFDEQPSVRVYRGAGCDVCHRVGYVGRVGIYEILEVNEEVRRAIVERNDAATIRAVALKHGMTTMIEDGLEKVKQGVTTIDEVLRVTKE